MCLKDMWNADFPVLLGERPEHLQRIFVGRTHVPDIRYHAITLGSMPLADGEENPINATAQKMSITAASQSSLHRNINSFPSHWRKTRYVAIPLISFRLEEHLTPELLRISIPPRPIPSLPSVDFA